MYVVYSLVVFFFKQKTAYEMRISDWSSDVCSSDLSRPLTRAAAPIEHRHKGVRAQRGLTPSSTLTPVVRHRGRRFATTRRRGSRSTGGPNVSSATRPPATLSPHTRGGALSWPVRSHAGKAPHLRHGTGLSQARWPHCLCPRRSTGDRKSTRLNSSH